MKKKTYYQIQLDALNNIEKLEDKRKYIEKIDFSQLIEEDEDANRIKEINILKEYIDSGILKERKIHDDAEKQSEMKKDLDTLYKIEFDNHVVIITPPTRVNNTHDIKILDKEGKLLDVLNLSLRFWTKDTNLGFRKFINFLEKNKIKLKNETNYKVSLEHAYNRYVTREETQQKEIIKLTAEEVEEATKLATEKDILIKILEAKDKISHAGEEKNFINVYMTGTSRKLQNPLSSVLKGGSSGGKSYTTKKALSFIPSEDIIDFTRLTPQALYHGGNLDFRHKILYVYEKDGSQQSDYSLRTFQSERQLKLGMPVKNPKTNELEMKYKVVEGPISLIETTTKSIVNMENETRVFDSFIDESENQTIKIFENRDKSIIPLSDEYVEKIINPFVNFQRILKVYDVIIPYLPLIQFPTKPLRVRRDREKFLAYIEASCLLHQYNREKIDVNGKTYLIANVFDYGVALLLSQDIIENIVENLNPNTKKIIDTAKELTNEGEDITYTNLRKKLDVSKSYISEWTKPAIEFGHLNVLEGGRGKPYILEVVEKEGCSQRSLLDRTQISDLIQLKGDALWEFLDQRPQKLEDIKKKLSLTNDEDEILKKLFLYIGKNGEHLKDTQNDTPNDETKGEQTTLNTKKRSNTHQKIIESEDMEYEDRKRMEGFDIIED